MAPSPLTGRLITGRLIKRYKRFLADVDIDDEVVTVHCPNTGPMTGCATPGWQVALSYSDNPRRKLPYTLEMIYNGSTWIGVNTHQANRLAEEALVQGKISELVGYPVQRREVKYGSENSRIDFLLQAPDKVDCYVEVKSVTLMENGTHLFPDTVTTRGQKHLRELRELPAQGKRAVMLYLIQREDGDLRFQAARHYDPVYADLLKEAHDAGVEVIAYQCEVSLTAWCVKTPLTVVFSNTDEWETN
jgi:sugar fermentation stimulation protein A